MTEQRPPSTLVSKITVIGVIIASLIGVVAWSSINHEGAQGFDPELAQEYAKHFQRRCMRDHSDRDLCRDAIGYHHRNCFNDHLRREDPEDPRSPFVYDRDVYMSCMQGVLAEETAAKN